MEYMYRPTSEEASADSARKAAAAAEAQRVLTWEEYKDRQDRLPLNDRVNDIFRLDMNTVPDVSRGLLESYRDSQQKSLF